VSLEPRLEVFNYLPGRRLQTSLIKHEKSMGIFKKKVRNIQ
jgi:hypothetical protein